MKKMFYRIDGTPYASADPLIEWATDFENTKHRIIKQTTLENGRRVSTVWLGFDHSFDGGPPLIFETMVFPKDSYSDLDMERYSTKEEAEAGHERMVKKWADG